jgi:hypothetical protein
VYSKEETVMKNFFSLINLVLASSLIMTVISCDSKKEPEVITTPVYNITQTTARTGGTIIYDKKSDITARGVCWSKEPDPTLDNLHTSDGKGNGIFESTIDGLTSETVYYVRSYASYIEGTTYGNEVSFKTLKDGESSQIIADHTVVDKYDDIPQYYIDKVKKMWVTIPGQSHSLGYRTGLALLEAADPTFDVSINESGTPEGYTTAHLRVSRATWGDYYDSRGWVYAYGEESWFTNSLGISRTKDGIEYCNTNGYVISAMGFGWCWDATAGTPTANADPVYGCRWYGESSNGPEGNKAWGLDDADYTVTGNSVCLDTYLSATQEYIDYCALKGYDTRVFFTTGPVDLYYGEAGYQGHLKYERIRNYVKEDPTRILFDYADILCYDNDGTPTTTTWNGLTYPRITKVNLSPTVDDMHISNAGALRLGKAMWWMLARIAGWDGGLDPY